MATNYKLLHWPC